MLTARIMQQPPSWRNRASFIKVSYIYMYNINDIYIYLSRYERAMLNIAFVCDLIANDLHTQNPYLLKIPWCAVLWMQPMSGLGSYK